MRFFQNQFSRKCNFPFHWVGVLGNIAIQKKEEYDLSVRKETEQVFINANDPKFLEALSLGSEVLVIQLFKIKNAADFLQNKKNRQTLRGILRYMTRACTRTTPFGKFASLVCNENQADTIEMVSLSPILMQYIVPYTESKTFLNSTKGLLFDKKMQILDEILLSNSDLKTKNQAAKAILNDIFEIIDKPIDLDTINIMYSNQLKLEELPILTPPKLASLAQLYFSIQKDIKTITNTIHGKKIENLNLQELDMQWQKSVENGSWEITTSNHQIECNPTKKIDLQSKYINCIMMYDEHEEKYIIHHIILSPYKLLQRYSNILPQSINKNYHDYFDNKIIFLSALNEQSTIENDNYYSDTNIFVRESTDFKDQTLQNILINEADWNGKLEQIAEDTLIEIIPKMLLYSTGINHSNFILKRNQWYLKSAFLKEKLLHLKDYEAFSTLYSFFDAYQLPFQSMIYIEEHPQYIHFNSPLLVHLFIHELEKANTWIKIEPFYPVPDGHAREYVVECII